MLFNIVLIFFKIIIFDFAKLWQKNSLVSWSKSKNQKCYVTLEWYSQETKPKQFHIPVFIPGTHLNSSLPLFGLVSRISSLSPPLPDFSFWPLTSWLWILHFPCLWPELILCISCLDCNQPIFFPGFQLIFFSPQTVLVSFCFTHLLFLPLLSTLTFPILSLYMVRLLIFLCSCPKPASSIHTQSGKAVNC